MTEPERPLHVKVAEALGWKRVPPGEIGDLDCGGTEFWRDPAQGFGSSCNVCRPAFAPPRYDTDWSATGPLIEKYGLQLASWWDPDENAEMWEAWNKHRDLPRGTFSGSDQPTVLLAVCHAILALSEAGKLKAVE